MITFRPAIYRGGVLYNLPRPITRLRIQESFDSQTFKVPLRDGELAGGQSRNGVDLLIEGQIGSQGEVLLLSEAQMLEELEALRNACHPGSPDELCELILYQDTGGSESRKYRDCSLVRLDTDLSNPWLFTYAITLRAHDPELKSDAPGEE